MSVNETLLHRVRQALLSIPTVEEKKMFGGICFMVNEKMCICVRRTDLLFRIGETQAAVELEKDLCRQMIHNGRVMKDFVFVEDTAVASHAGLNYWINLSLLFNEQAKPSKGRRSPTL